MNEHGLSYFHLEKKEYNIKLKKGTDAEALGELLRAMPGSGSAAPAQGDPGAEGVRMDIDGVGDRAQIIDESPQMRPGMFGRGSRGDESGAGGPAGPDEADQEPVAFGTGHAGPLHPCLPCGDY